MALVTRGLWAWALAGLTLACGDTLVDDTYSGTPRYSVPGNVNGTSSYVDAEHPEVNVAVFWALHWREGNSTFHEQPGTAQRAEFYRPFELKLFDEPGPEFLTTQPSGAKVGVAWVAAYQDANGNGHRDDDEPLIGSSTGRLLIRAPQALSAQDSPTGAPLPEGWHLVSAPLNCPVQQPPGSTAGGSGQPLPTADCGVPLGEPCKNDADCGGGVCVHDFVGNWPSGACLIPEPPPNGCRQRGSVLLKDPQDAMKGYWIKACQVNADCGRPAPFQCDMQLRGCRASANVQLELNDQPPPRGFCQPPEGSTPQG